jgi:hypothetical protein
MSDPKPSIKQRAYQGLKDYLAISLYLWVIFGMFVLYRSVILDEQNIPFVAHGLALLNALALAKVILLAQDLHFGERYRKEPLIYGILFKSAIFAALLGCFKILEEATIGWFHGKSFTDSLMGIGGGTLEGILSLAAILFIILIPFFALGELREVFGKEKLHVLFFNSRDDKDVSS